MNILLVAATWMEVNLLVDELEKTGEKSHLFKEYRFGEMDIDILITGIGTVFTTFHLTNALKDKRYNMVINIGIAGSMTRELKIGEVVNVVYDEFADLGIETQNDFLTLFEAGFMNINEYPFENGVLKATNSDDFIDLKKVRGVTTNRSHGNENSIIALHTKYTAHTESMEGAAVFYVCKWMGVDCYQVRSISNYVEPRDSSKWNIPLALEKLKECVLNLLKNAAVTVC